MDWQAEWIWIKGEESPKNFYLCLRKPFELDNRPKKAVVFVSADSRYKLYINGKFIARGPAKCDPSFQYYDTVDISKYLHKGKNVVASLVHHFGENTFSYILGRGGFLCQLEIEYTGNKKYIIKSDDSWCAKENPCWNRKSVRSSVQTGYSEVYDSRLEMENWKSLQFNDSKWQKAITIGHPPIKPWTEMLERDIPFLREKNILPQTVIETGICPQTIDLNDIEKIAYNIDLELHLPDDAEKTKKARNIVEGWNKQKTKNAFLTIPKCIDKSYYIVVDFGKEVTGFPMIEIDGVSGGIIDMGFDETLIEGRVCPTRRNNPMCMPRYADRYIMKNGRQEHEQSFLWRGFRYMQLTFRNCQKPVKLRKVKLNHYEYPAKYRGNFSCSDELLNKIWHVGRHTLQMCMHDSYEDCPGREQTQWWGDARVQGLVNFYTFQDTQLFKKGLRQIAESQYRRNDGLMLPFAPGGYKSSVHDNMGVIPGFCLIWILSLYDFYFYSGDKEPMQKLYANLKKLLQAFKDSLSERGFTTLEHWQFIDWAEIDTKGENAALNLFLYAALLCAGEIAKLNNDRNSVNEYMGWATELKNSINKYLWIEEKGLYCDGFHDGKPSEVFSQQTNCLAVLFDVVPKEKQKEILKKIQNDASVVKIKTPYFMFYFISALIKTDAKEQAITLIRQRWGEMIGKGATTFWEEFGGISLLGGTGSLCHAWSACPVFFLSQEILGVKPLEPGFKKILIEPKLCGLDHAKGSIPLASGDIKVSWRINTVKGQKILSFSASAPKESLVELILPEKKGTKKYSFKGKITIKSIL